MSTKSVAEQLMEAYQASENTGEGNFQKLINSDPRDVTEEYNQKQAETEKKAIVVEPEPVKVEAQQTTQQYTTSQYVAPQYSEPKPQPVHTPEPVYTPETKTPTYTAPSVSYNTTNYLDVRDIRQVVRILDTYRNFDIKIQESVKQFIQLNSEDIGDIINGIINVTNEEKFGLRDLVQLKEEERTSRAFSLVALPDQRLHKVRDLVLLFNNNFKPRENFSDRVLYCREVEIGIEELPKQALAFLKPISTLLAIEKE